MVAEGDWSRRAWTMEGSGKGVERSWKRLRRELNVGGGDLEGSGGEVSWRGV